MTQTHTGPAIREEDTEKSLLVPLRDRKRTAHKGGCRALPGDQAWVGSGRLPGASGWFLGRSEGVKGELRQGRTQGCWPLCRTQDTGSRPTKEQRLELRVEGEGRG